MLNIITGQVSNEAATINCESLESKDSIIELPNEEVWLSRGYTPKSNTILQGHGIGKTILKQQFSSYPFGVNCVFNATGSGFSHVDPIEINGDEIITNVAPHCLPGTLIYTFIYDGYRESGQIAQRRIVMGSEGNSLKLDQPVDDRANAIKWFSDAAPILDVNEGSSKVIVTDGEWSVGMDVIVTSGPSIANEAAGETVKIIGVNGNEITLSKPLRRSYTEAALAKLNMISRVNVRDLTMALPITQAAGSLHSTKIKDFKFERCEINGITLGNCSNVTFEDCDLNFAITVNTSHNCQFINCRIQGIHIEEDSRDILIDKCTVGPGIYGQNCVSIGAAAERVSVLNSLLIGPRDLSSCPIIGGGRESIFSNLKITGNGYSWISGDNIILSKIISESEIVLQKGMNMSVSQIRAKKLMLGWPGFESSGVCIDGGNVLQNVETWSKLL